MTPYLQERALYPPLIRKRPSPLLGIVVVIPCYDEDFLLLSLMSLHKCLRPTCDVEVIVVINHSENENEKVIQKNRKTCEQATRWITANRTSHLHFHVLFMDQLPRKHAGVGLARKIGMDEACYRLSKAGTPNGIITCFDADSRCDPNYFQAIEKYFLEKPNARACSIYFEHPLSGPDYEEEVYQAISRYELHLRYYIHAQRWAGFPHAWQTIGSSMAVRANAYQKQGGMNRRKAGEDFYFLHKFIPLGHFGEIITTRVIPSPRPSHRVPFGTGKAVGELLQNQASLQTYHPDCFKDLSVLLKTIGPQLYDSTNPAKLLAQLPESVRLFLHQNKGTEKIEEVRRHTANRKNFEKRLWKWFDAFLLMKYVHFARDHFYPNVNVEEAAAWLLSQLTGESPPEKIATPLLLQYRKMARRK